MPRYGIILETKGDRAIVSSSRRGVCAECSERDACSFDSALGKDVPEKIEAINDINASPGDYVEMDVPGRAELKAAVITWFVPLIGLVLGAALGAWFQTAFATDIDRDMATFIGAIIGTAVFILPAILYDRMSKGNPAQSLHVLRRLPPSSCPDSLKKPGKI